MSDDYRVPLKYMLWEEAKGKLRALAAVQGSYPSGDPETAKRFEALTAKVEAFIKEVNDEELQE